MERIKDMALKPTDFAMPTGQPAGSEIEHRTMRKVSRRLIPTLMLCYFVAYLDRVNISFAALQMNRHLGLTSTAYGLGAGLFFVTYCALEVPSNLLLHKFGATRWIARIMVTWGICAGAMAFAQGERSFYVLRLLVGAAEAGFYPGVLFFLTLWFPAAYRGRVIGLFLAAIPISGVIGSPLSGALLNLRGVGGLDGWQWLFLVEALPAILLAPVVLRVLSDGPAGAGWLQADERAWLSGVLDNEARARETIKSYSVVQALTNPWVLFLALVYFSNVVLLNGLQFFLPQIVKGFGLSDMQTGLVAAIPSVPTLAILIWWGRRSDRKRERYGHAAVANLIAGSGLLLAMLVHEPVLRVALISVALAFTLAFTAPFWTIPGTFLSSAALAGGIAAISAIGVTGGLFAPWLVGATRDMTGDFRVGLGGIALFGIVIAILFFILGRRRAAADTVLSCQRI
jgi:sugar phosphate permease